MKSIMVADASRPFIEPTGDAKAGSLQYRRPPSAWEQFQKEEGIPVYKGVGMYDSRELPREDWERVGGRGTYIQLFGTNNQTGMFVVEVPARGALTPQKHLYEERYIVLEGSGTTEVWKEGSTKRTAFEWRPWSLFSIPLNAWFRIANGTSSPALLLGANTAPLAINTYQSRGFIFDNPFSFDERYDASEDYWKPRNQIEAHPVTGRALLKTNLFPNVASCPLPLDNHRAAGYRRVEPKMAGNTLLRGFIAEYPSGRYSKAHAHAGGAVLVCLKGKGYSFTWPREQGGLTPWRAGKTDLVKMQEYRAGGMVSAAPGPANWFHQHFAISKEPFRVFNFTGVSGQSNRGNEGGELVRKATLIDTTEGGSTIPYHLEDPFVRGYYRSRLEEEGAELTMPPALYAHPRA